MVTSWAKKKVILLSDDDSLTRVVELALNKRLVTKIGKISSEGTENLIEACDFDLIIVAASSPTSEPVVILAQASLARCIGRVPILIISDKPFQPDPDARIYHLDFPFKLPTLYSTVEEILQGS